MFFFRRLPTGRKGYANAYIRYPFIPTDPKNLNVKLRFRTEKYFKPGQIITT